MEEAKIMQIGNFSESKRENPNQNRVYDQKGLCPTITQMTGGGREPMIVDETITTRPEDKKTAVLPMTEEYRIRKFTPRECWRLMGYTDTDFEKASKVVSNSQLYKQAGNAIVKQVLMAIFLQLNIQGIKNWNDRTMSEKEKLAGGAE